MIDLDLTKIIFLDCDIDDYDQIFFCLLDSNNPGHNLSTRKKSGNTAQKKKALAKYIDLYEYNPDIRALFTEKGFFTLAMHLPYTKEHLNQSTELSVFLVIMTDFMNSQNK